MEKTITVVLPALNEERTIGQVIDEIPRDVLETRGYNVDVLVVDGRSKDRTKEIAKEKGARIVVQKGRGKGRAMRTVFPMIEADYTFMLDCDGTYSPEAIPEMLDKLEEGADVVVGSRLKGSIEKGAMRPINYLGNKMLTNIAVLLYGRPISDLCTGMWGFSRRTVSEMKLTAEQFELEAEMYTVCANNGYLFQEIPINYKSRVSKAKLGTVKDGARIFTKLFERRFKTK